jgi:hypothetical protein
MEDMGWSRRDNDDLSTAERFQASVAE